MKRIFTLLLLLTTLCTTLFAEKYYYFEHLSTLEGLPNNTIYCSLQDRSGFMWIGTRDGLCRYDGKSFVRLSDIAPAHEMTGVVLAIAEDRSGTIWFSSSNGVGYYDPATDKAGTLAMTDDDICWDVEADEKGNVWFAADELIRYDTENARTHTYSFGELRPYMLAVDSIGSLWVLMRSGEVYTYDRLKDSFIRQNASESIKLLHPVEGGRLLVATMNEEVYLLDCISLSTRLIFTPEKNMKIRCLCESSAGEFWIGTDKGLFIRTESDNYKGSAFHDRETPASLSADLITSLDKDLEGNIWVGTYYTGINIWKDTRDEMSFYFRNPSDDSIKGEIVRSICLDSEGKLWFCTEDGWLGNLDPKTRKTGNWQITDKLNMHDLIIEEGKIWICTYGNGLYLMDKDTKRVSRHYDLPDNNLSSGLKTAAGDLLVGTKSGMYRYERDIDSFCPVSGTENRHIHCLYQDSRGTIWVGTYGNGLICLDEEMKVLAEYNTNHPASGLTSRFITSFMEDSRKRIWITTEGGGINLAHPEQKIDSLVFTNITTKDGLTSNVTCAAAEDKEGTIWVSTTNGITSISGNDLKVTGHLNGSNKVTGYQYSYGSVCPTPGGVLYFGNTDGMISFMPSFMKSNNTKWDIHLTAIEARNSNRTIPLKNEGKSAMASTSITVSHKDASAIFISFSVPEYSTRNLIYRYSVSKGKRERFSGTTRENSVLLSGLRPGKYTFEVGTMGDSVQPRRLEMKILPHPLMSHTALIIYIIIGIICFIGFLYQADFRRKRERARQYAKLVNNKEKEIYNAKINFYTNITHEIRTPLSLIKMPVDKIIASGMYTAESEKDLKTIQANTDRLLSLTNQLLDMRKMESNEMKLSFIKEDLGAIVRKAAGMFEQMAIDSHITVNLNMPEEPLYIMCAKDSVLTIVINLLSNALKYGKSIVNIVVSSLEDTAFVRVESDGEIIPEEEREKIFLIFFQRDGASKAGQGTGLGLPYARNLANMHNGKLYLDGNVTEMNSFVLELPVRQKEEVQIPLPPPAHKSEGKEIHDFDITRHTVIIVEDSEEMRDYLAEELSEEYNIKTAANGADALEIIKREKIDLVISDIMMPIMDGCELCNHIKSDSDMSHIPVILLTAVVGTETRIETLEVGADGYIEKPFPIELLKSNVANLFKNKEISYRQFMNKPLTHYSSVTASKVDQEYMDKVHDFIMKHIAETDLNIENLTLQLGTSKSSLYRKLKANTGLSINEYIRLCRLKQAAELLSSQKYKINEVAFMTGFSSPSYFATCFQKQFNITPSEFVKNLGQ